MLRVSSFGVVLLAAAASIVAHPRLPPVMAIHWNAQGVADGFAPKTVALALTPAIMLVVAGILAVVGRKADSRGYDATALGTQVFLLYVHGVMIAAGLGVPVSIERAVPFGISLLFAYLGLFMPGLPPNPVMGIRTRRTLSDPELWRRTHVFAGRLFVVGGLALAALSFAGASFWLVFAGFLALGFVPLCYATLTSTTSR